MSNLSVNGVMTFFSDADSWIDAGERIPLTIFADFLSRMDGRCVSLDQTKSSFVMRADEKSLWLLSCGGTRDSTTMTARRDRGDGTSPTDYQYRRIYDYFDATAIALNARRVMIEVGDDYFSLVADPDEKVFELYYESDKLCLVPDREQERVCQIGEGPQTCIFLIAHPKGFACAKFSSALALILLDKARNGQISARRIGNCACRGVKPPVTFPRPQRSEGAPAPSSRSWQR